MLGTRLNDIHDDRNLAGLVDTVEGRPLDLSDARIMRDREAMENAVFDILTTKGAQPRSPRSLTARVVGVIAGMIAGAVALALFSLSPAPASERIEGRATIVDGDTVAVEGTDARIRLYGIDAPESGQTCDDARGQRYLCGTRSAEYLAQLVGRTGRLTCFEEDRDRYGRIVAECVTPGNVVVNAAMIEAGWAAHYTQYSDGRYDQEEAEARAAGRGMWAGEFVLPWDWRRGDRLASETAAVVTEQGAPSSDCVIKGNISASGRIYHTPQSRHYERTQIDESAGERWFCSTGEAERAGWRAPRG